MSGFLKKSLKTLVGIVLLPVCWSAFRANAALIAKLNPLHETDLVVFLAGAGLFCALFLFWDKPLRLYVWGHEMTHVIAIVLCRGKVKKISSGKNSGYVKSDKINFIISLAPYYFPFYAALVCLLFNLCALLFPVIGEYTRAYVFILGLALAFHLLFTFYVVRKGQEDIKYNGWVFSAVTIVAVNTVLFGIFLSIPAKETGPAGFLSEFSTFALKDFLRIFYALFHTLQG